MFPGRANLSPIPPMTAHQRAAARNDRRNAAPVPVAYSAGASCPAALNGVRAKIRRTIGSKDSSGSDS